MRKVTTALLGAVVLLIIAAGGGANKAASAEFASFNTRESAFTYLDIGPKGPTIGDASATRWVLTDRHGHQIGIGQEVCRWTSSTTRICTGVYELPLGDIVYAGAARDGHYMAVTGGTNHYRGALGQLSRKDRTVYVSLN